MRIMLSRIIMVVCFPCLPYVYMTLVSTVSEKERQDDLHFFNQEVLKKLHEYWNKGRKFYIFETIALLVSTAYHLLVVAFFVCIVLKFS